MEVEGLDDHELALVVATAKFLLSGSATSGFHSDLRFPVQRAALALGADLGAFRDSIRCLPAAPTEESLATYAIAESEGFELLALVVGGCS
jgi:hypothetical protein